MIKEGSIIKKNSKKHSKNSIRERKESKKKVGIVELVKEKEQKMPELQLKNYGLLDKEFFEIS